jgi:hypothetical protein
LPNLAAKSAEKEKEDSFGCLFQSNNEKSEGFKIQCSLEISTVSSFLFSFSHPASDCIIFLQGLNFFINN